MATAAATAAEPLDAAAETPPEVVETEPEGLYEVIDGQVVEIEPMGAFESWIASRLFQAMVTTPGVVDRGRAAVEMLVRIASTPRLDLRPDLAFVSFDRWPAARQVPRVAAWEVVPDLAVEVVSPTNRTGDDLQKVDHYFRAGVRLVWLVLPNVSRVYVYESPSSLRVLSRGDALDGGAVLPGFRLTIDDLFGPEEG